MKKGLKGMLESIALHADVDLALGYVLFLPTKSHMTQSMLDTLSLLQGCDRIG